MNETPAQAAHLGAESLRRQHLAQRYENLALQRLFLALEAPNPAAKEVFLDQALDYADSAQQARRGERNV